MRETKCTCTVPGTWECLVNAETVNTGAWVSPTMERGNPSAITMEAGFSQLAVLHRGKTGH